MSDGEITSWSPEIPIRATRALLEQRMRKAMVRLEGQVKRLISRANPTGLTPSLPGEPPKVVTGTLRSNVAHHVTTEGQDVVGLVGVRKPVRYGKELELGAIRNGRILAPRPYLRPSLVAGRQQILETLVKG